MALKKSEKKLIGIALIAGGIALVVGVGLPQWDAVVANQAKATSFNQEIQNLTRQKESLNTQIAVLSKNGALPAGIEVKTYRPDNKEQIIKEILDQVVSSATQAGNRLIRLTPSVDTEPPKPPEKTEKEKTANAANQPADASGGNAQKEPPSTQIDSFDYDLVIRGQYDTIQTFLSQAAARKTLIEIGNLTLEDDTAVTTSGQANHITDPAAPIRLTAKVRIVLQPAS